MRIMAKRKEETIPGRIDRPMFQDARSPTGKNPEQLLNVLPV